MVSKTPGTIINTNILPTNVVLSDVNNRLIITRRGNGTPGALTLGLLNDIPLYQIYRIPAQYLTDPAGLLSFFESQGATVMTGVMSSINLVAPDVVTPFTQNGQDFVTLTWNTEPFGWSDISGITVSGIATQNAVTGTIYRILSGTTYQIILSNVSGGSFNTADPVTLTYSNLSVELPDALTTERFVTNSYYAAAALAQNESTVNVTVTVPTVDLLIMSDRDALFNPDNTPISLGMPDDVALQTDGNYILSWDTAPANWLYVPQNEVGSSFVGVSGTSDKDSLIIQQLGPQYTPTGEGVALLVGPPAVTPILTSDILQLNMDATFNVLEVAKQNDYKFVTVDYELDAAIDITEAAGDLFPFTQYLSEVNLPTSVQQQLFGTIGIVGTTQVTVEELLTFGEINNGNYSVPFFPYFPSLGDPIIRGGDLASSYCAIMASVEVPFPNMDNFILNGLPVPSNVNTYISVGTDKESDTVLNAGLTPIGVNAESQAYIVRSVTTQLTLPGTSVLDEEFFDTHVAQVKWELKKRTYFASKLPQFQNALITPSLIDGIKNAIKGVLFTAQDEEMIFDVQSVSFPSIQIVQNAGNPQQLDISYDVKVTQALEQQVYTINLVSTVNTTTSSVTLAQAS